MAVANAQTISVVVPAQRVTASRPAHFNWQFKSTGGGDVQIGQFADGSYWVAPANGDTGVVLLSLTGNPAWTDYLSCDVDPITESHGLLSGANKYGSYNAAENILTQLPMTFSPLDGSCNSLVAAMQRNEDATSKGGTKAIVGEVVDAYCVVTVMPTPPANGGADMIRPNFTGGTKEFLTWDDFDLNRIHTYPFIAGNSAASWDEAQTRWRHSTEVFSMSVVNPDGSISKFSEGGRAFRSAILVHDYASGMTAAFNNDLLALFSQDTLEAKKPALAAMLAYGLDIYHARYDPGNAKPKAWSSGAGQSSGQFLPPVFLAALSKNPAKAQQLQTVAIYNHGTDASNLGPQELRQIARGQTGVLLWGDGQPFNRTNNVPNGDDYRYWADMLGSWCFDTSVKPCAPNKGKKTYADIYGYIDGPANQPGIFYMSVSYGSVQSLAAAMILMPEIRSIVNTDAPIEYSDRVLRHGMWTVPDPVAPPSVDDQTNGCTAWYKTDTCSSWGILWGPNLDDLRFAIEDGVGRFTSKHGNPVSVSYTSSRASGNWATILGMYDGPTYESFAVPLGVVVTPEIFIESVTEPKAHVLEATIDGEIRYTLDGTDPTESSMLYTGPIPLSGDGELRVRGYHPEKTPSAVLAKSYSFPLTPELRMKLHHSTANKVRLELLGLIPNKHYRIETTNNLAARDSWTTIHEFTANSDSFSWETDVSGNTPHFFRSVNGLVASAPVSAYSLP